MERIRQRRLNRKISRSEQAEAGSKHHRPKSKLSTRSGGGAIKEAERGDKQRSRWKPLGSEPLE